jgi:hydrogenase maturation protein HypF
MALVERAAPVDREAWSIRVRGTVQGVGFRPFVYRVATDLGLDGSVRNVDGEVVIEAAGPPGALRALASALRGQAPPLAVVEAVTVRPGRGGAVAGPGFLVAASGRGGGAAPLSGLPADGAVPLSGLPADGAVPLSGLPADVATCADCLAELLDPGDRRYRYPFINCTNCGPRATIVDELPYDRARTAMAGFPLCPACAAEYADPADRRFHAEPVACPDCGPTLSWLAVGAAGPPGAWVEAARAEAALAAAVDTLAGGGIVALKGLGGYQLVGDATRPSTVDELRRRKGRPRKPFAVMVPDLAAAAGLARLTGPDRTVLGGPARPIVLLPARTGGVLAPGVHPGTDRVGLFLPYTPLHHLLLRALARPLVVTSGNLSDEPIAIDDDDAVARLGGVADGFLRHDRPIRARYDDSVVRAGSVVLRRARGYAPEPLALPVPAGAPVLAVGAQLKHTFTLAVGDRALVGPHGGSLDDADALAAFHATLAQLCRLHRFTPEVLAHDLHPGYVSTRYAAGRPARARVGVQHHHAHVVSCAAEHGLTGPFLGVAYDGLGFGDDGTLWGGEVLLASYAGYRRLGRFARAPLPGGEAAVRRPARMALGYLLGGETAVDPAAARGFADRLDPREVAVVARMVERGVNSPVASSAGRLFDAVASLLGVCDDASYEGEAAVMLEAVAGRATGRAVELPWRVTESGGLWVYDCRPTLAAVLDGVRTGGPVADLAAAFHRTIVAVTVELCGRAAERTGVRRVCLSGGCLQNAILATGLVEALERAGLTVYRNRVVPPGDGGISYGQAVVAAARGAEGS